MTKKKKIDNKETKKKKCKKKRKELWDKRPILKKCPITLYLTSGTCYYQQISSLQLMKATLVAETPIFLIVQAFQMVCGSLQTCQIGVASFSPLQPVLSGSYIVVLPNVRQLSGPADYCYIMFQWRKRTSWSWRSGTGFSKDNHGQANLISIHWFPSSVLQFHFQCAQVFLVHLTRTATAT